MEPVKLTSVQNSAFQRERAGRSNGPSVEPILAAFVLLLVTLAPAIEPSPREVSAAQAIGVTDPYAVIAEQSIPLPIPGATVTDTPFNTTLRRITDAAAGDMERHEYSQLQAFNADSSLILLTRGDGSFIVREVATLSHVGTLPVEANSPRGREYAVFPGGHLLVAYSQRNATTTSIRAARRAGIALAMRTAAITANATAA